jgi:hypothetical protein
VKSKNFPGAMPPDPRERAGEGSRGEGRLRQRKGGRGERKDGMGGRAGEEREGEGREMEGTGIWGEVCVMAFGGMDAPVGA